MNTHTHIYIYRERDTKKAGAYEVD